MKALAVLLALFALFVSAPLFGALPGVTEIAATPERIPDAELAAMLDARVAGADVVAIGETAHGSSGFLRIQTRLVRYLVVRHGFRLIVWENPALRSLELARWVDSCTKSLTPPPVAVLYMPTPADVAFFEWVCGFNLANAGDPIVFRGMDIWDRTWEHYSRMQSLGRALTVDSAMLDRIRTSCPAHDAKSWPEVDDVLGRLRSDDTVFDPAAYDACRAALTSLLNAARRIGHEKKKRKEADAGSAFELALSASTMLGWLGFHQYNWADDIRSWNARDLAQGTNIMLAMEQHDARRAIVSAHTSHVSHNRSRADWWGFGDIKSGISFFAGLTGKKVFNVALTGYDVSGTQGHWSAPTAASSVDKKLHAAGHRFSFFPSNAAFLAEHPRWWIQNQNYPGPYESGVELVLRDHFDAFFFMDKSHLDRALPARPMWQP